MKWYEKLNPFKRDKLKTLEAITGLRFYPNSTAGTLVTVDSALTLSAVWAAVDVISNNVAVIEFEAVEKLQGGGRASAYQHPAYDLVNSTPNEFMSSFHFKKLLLVHALLYENGGWAEVIRQDGINPTAIIPLNPLSTGFEKMDGLLMVATQDDKSSPKRWLNPANVIHLHGLSVNGIDSLGLIRKAKESLGLTIATEQFSSAFFGNGAWMGAFVETVAQLSQKSQEQLVDSLKELNQGPGNAHKLISLPYGTKIVPNEVDLQKCNLKEIREYQILEVCRWFNIQPTKLFDYSNGTLANFEQANIEHYTTTLMPWLTNLEAELNRKLFNVSERKTFAVKHNMTLSVLRGDPSTIADVCSKLVGGPILSANEARALFGLNPIGGADRLLQPVNMQAIQAQSIDKEPSFNDALDQSSKAIGVNTSVRTALPAPTEAPALPAPAAVERDLTGRARAVAVETFSRLHRREVTALRRAVSKPEQLLSWIEGFYPEHATFAEESLGSVVGLLGDVAGKNIDTAQVARSLAQASRQELEGLVKSVEPADLADAVERLCQRWESRPEEVVDLLLATEGE